MTREYPDFGFTIELPPQTKKWVDGLSRYIIEAQPDIQTNTSSQQRRSLILEPEDPMNICAFEFTRSLLGFTREMEECGGASEQDYATLLWQACDKAYSDASLEGAKLPLVLPMQFQSFRRETLASISAFFDIPQELMEED